jgi:hypothetical protein
VKLFDLAYACRIFQGEFDDSYKRMCEGLGPNPDLKPNPDSASKQPVDHLLQFLNDWGCRIPEKHFPALKDCLLQWASQRIIQLPEMNRDIRFLNETERLAIGDAYDALLKAGRDFHFWGTATAKTLHAVRRNTLPMWDARIRDSFIDGRREFAAYSGGQIYSEFIRYVGEQISELEQEVIGLGYSLSEVPQLVDRRNVSLVKLVDEYYWITITEGHISPNRDELERWLRWIVTPDRQTCRARLGQL